MDAHGSVRIAGFVTLYFYAFLALCIWQAARERKNWARWILLILFAIALPAFHLPDLTLVAMILRVGQLLAVAVALVLISTGNARAWFERNSPQPGS
jgi:peptidoglycan/LPS O-acetylase OafA/YrhL